jgi:hypothetical protein
LAGCHRATNSMLLVETKCGRDTSPGYLIEVKRGPHDRRVDTCASIPPGRVLPRTGQAVHASRSFIVLACGRTQYVSAAALLRQTSLVSWQTDAQRRKRAPWTLTACGAAWAWDHVEQGPRRQGRGSFSMHALVAIGRRMGFD